MNYAKGGYGNWLLSLVALNSRHRARNVLTLFEFRDRSMSVVFELNVIFFINWPVAVSSAAMYVWYEVGIKDTITICWFKLKISQVILVFFVVTLLVLKKANPSIWACNEAAAFAICCMQVPNPYDDYITYIMIILS